MWLKTSLNFLNGSCDEGPEPGKETHQRSWTLMCLCIEAFALVRTTTSICAYWQKLMSPQMNLIPCDGSTVAHVHIFCPFSLRVQSGTHHSAIDCQQWLLQGRLLPRQGVCIINASGKREMSAVAGGEGGPGMEMQAWTLQRFQDADDRPTALFHATLALLKNLLGATW